MIESNICGVYRFLNKKNGKVYIGSSKNIAKRIRAHLSKLKNNSHINKHFQAAYNKYGVESFDITVLEECDEYAQLKTEQKYLDLLDKNKCYNKTFIANGGGADTLANELLLLDLDGNIVKQFKSGTSVAKFLDVKILTYKNINTPSIARKKYRIVTPQFYEENVVEIKSWKNYSCEAKKRTEEFKRHKYKVEKEGCVKTFNTHAGVSEYIGISRERVRQIYKKLDKTGKKYHLVKSTLHYLSFVEK